MPEIIRRKIKLDLSLAVQLTPAIMLGLSVKPYDILDIIKIVKQPDGTSPIIHRYRGEFLFTSSTSTEDRNARTRGMDIRPQLMLNFSRLKALFMAGMNINGLKFMIAHWSENMMGITMESDITFLRSGVIFLPMNLKAA